MYPIVGSMIDSFNRLFFKKPPKKRTCVHCGSYNVTFSNISRKKIKLEIACKHSKKENKKISLESRLGYFDSSSLHFINAFLIEEGILIFYFVDHPCCSIGAALFDQHNPEVLLWRSANPIFQEEKGATPIKISLCENHVDIVFSKEGKKKKICFSLESLLSKFKKPTKTHNIKREHPSVQRSEKNPIIQPELKNTWECCATFNPAAIYLDGKVHFIYRAIGHNGMSVLGYASSTDGIHVDERLTEPVYIPTEPFEYHGDKHNEPVFNYISGCNWGCGWGGCEDPRLSRIDDMIYMTYTAFNGAMAPGVALTAISVEDFLNKNWRWKKSVLISPYGSINKNWIVFPEKIEGKFAILHGISPKISIDYFDDLEFKNNTHIKSSFSPAYRNGCWDNQLRGIGPPPVKTDDGWLVFYHAMDKNDPNKYKLGAMLLDKDDPTKILCRALRPVLEPDAYYENVGHKSGVIYSCGAVVIDDQLFVYYGGADKVSCVATATLSTFLKRLKESQAFKPKKGLTSTDISIKG